MLCRKIGIFGIAIIALDTIYDVFSRQVRSWRV